MTEDTKIIAAGTGAVVYEAEVSKNGQHRDVLFTADGREAPKK